jgi:hypothetical protein
MKRISVVVDEDTLNLLEGEVNKSDTIRKSLKLYNSAITPDTIEGFKAAFGILDKNIKNLENLIKEINSKIDYMAKKYE